MDVEKEKKISFIKIVDLITQENKVKIGIFLSFLLGKDDVCFHIVR